MSCVEWVRYYSLLNPQSPFIFVVAYTIEGSSGEKKRSRVTVPRPAFPCCCGTLDDMYIYSDYRDVMMAARAVPTTMIRMEDSVAHDAILEDLLLAPIKKAKLLAC